MQGWLVVNGYLKSEKFEEIYRWLIDAAEKMTYHISKDKSLWIMNLCGIILAFGELYKQLFLYVIVNHGKYDWWYFPFQLCSTPMYL